MSCCFCHKKVPTTSNVGSDSECNNSNEINSLKDHMELNNQIDDKTIRVLILGTGNSGKTTILKQIKRINNKYDTEHLNERRKAIVAIQRAVIEYMQILCEQSQILHEHYNEDTAINTKRDYLRKEIMALKSPFTLTDEIAFKIKSLWGDKGIKQTLRKRNLFQIHDNVAYFMNQIETISDTAYLPSFDDYLRFHQNSIGVSRVTVKLYDRSFVLNKFEFIDVKGQRCERKKWRKFIEGDINAVLYVLAISDYDLKLVEDDETNCLVEAIHFFRNTMIKSNCFQDKILMILFNKFDEFKKKIKDVPITVAFDDFPVDKMNPNNQNDVIQFVAGKLSAVFEEENVELTSPLRIIRTNALDKDQIEQIMTDIASNVK